MFFVAIIANLPLPIIVALNLRVTWRYLQVRKLSRGTRPTRPERFVIGWWINNLALIFTWTPVIVERRLFVQNHYWIISYAVAAALSITGLLFMNSGLGEEIAELEGDYVAPAVDTPRSDKL